MADCLNLRLRRSGIYLIHQSESKEACKPEQVCCQLSLQISHSDRLELTTCRLQLKRPYYHAISFTPYVVTDPVSSLQNIARINSEPAIIVSAIVLFAEWCSCPHHQSFSQSLNRLICWMELLQIYETKDDVYAYTTMKSQSWHYNLSCSARMHIESIERYQHISTSPSGPFVFHNRLQQLRNLQVHLYRKGVWVPQMHGFEFLKSSWPFTYWLNLLKGVISRLMH